MIYYAITAVMSLIGAWVSNRLQSKFKQYSEVRLRSNMSGKDVAEKMLSFYNIRDVKVVEGQGYLSDHYNPLTKTVALSPEVYQGRSVSAAAVAAHECGHAVQHDTAYAMLKLRSAIVPVVKVASMASQFLLMFAFMLANTFPSLLLITIIAFAITCLFSIITLPVEFDASKRALVWLDQSGTAQGEEYEGAKDALKWAAMTYVSAALSSLVMLIFLILRYMGTNRE
ncbi:MAG TPA: zinc metallopeptidase [Saprospiraceae bacterium]|nr:zinc metallopeptidase [Saprospiraceae bacterium]HUN17503.1 zinc metallopeptidase [Saprospiraceae bacterium]